MTSRVIYKVAINDSNEKNHKINAKRDLNNSNDPEIFSIASIQYQWEKENEIASALNTVNLRKKI